MTTSVKCSCCGQVREISRSVREHLILTKTGPELWCGECLAEDTCEVCGRAVLTPPDREGRPVCWRCRFIAKDDLGALSASEVKALVFDKAFPDKSKLSEHTRFLIVNIVTEAVLKEEEDGMTSDEIDRAYSSFIQAVRAATEVKL